MSILKLADDYQLHYQLIEGDPDKPYLVFLHEGLGCTAMWKNFPQRLCSLTACPGLVYDRLGYGQSSTLRKERTVHYMHEYALQELPQILAVLLAQRSYILVGHSDGASISLIAAAEQPPLLKGLISEAAHVFVEPETIAGIKAADAAYDAGKLRALEKFHGDKTAAIFKAWSQTWLKPAFASWNIEYLLPSIQVPLLAIQGVDDQYGSQLQVASIVEKTLGPSFALMIEDCGHSPHAEAQERVLAEMVDFISTITLAQN
ncbi:MAG: alpha/beta hydrolase [Pseudomonadales bacterium]|nr:alpha/beta hydrolase [Pseudomonadales bacterium]